jgi:hypothetical protein
MYASLEDAILPLILSPQKNRKLQDMRAPVLIPSCLGDQLATSDERRPGLRMTLEAQE